MSQYDVSASTCFRRGRLILALTVAALVLPGCSLMSAAGPSSRAVTRSGGTLHDNANIRILDLTPELTRTMITHERTALFSSTFGETNADSIRVGPGDIVDVMIWEAPPATLFGVNNAEAFSSSSMPVSRQTVLPGQMVSETGEITVPFAGSVQAAGRTTQEIGADIVRRLRSKAHLPQVIVKLSDNATTNVTVVGEVQRSLRMPLTAKRERLLDALAAAGGAKQPVGKTTVQLTRGSVVETLPLDTIIRDPSQNVTLRPNDVITALYQPYSFTALGAVGRNAEIDFEGTGLTLAQALGRIGGVDDNKANPRGAFIFRLEDKAVMGLADDANVRTTPEGKVPVIFRLDLRNPETFFMAQSFHIRNKDVIYISNAPLADLQKFVNIVASLVYPVVSIENATR